MKDFLNKIKSHCASIFKKIYRRTISLLKKIKHYSPTTPSAERAWNVPLKTRQKMIQKSKAAGKKIAISIYPYADATFRYRCYNPYLATKKSKSWQLIYYQIDELRTILSVLPQANLLILMRLPNSPEVEKLINAAREQDLKIVFEIDDRICHHSFLPVFKKSLQIAPKDYAFWEKYVANYESVAVQADAFLTTNSTLSADLSSTFHKPAQTIPNTFNAEQLAASKRAITKTTKTRTGNNVFRLGYFSGSATHNADLALIATPLAKFLQNHPNARLLLAGHITPPSALKPVESQIEHFKFTDYLTLQATIASVDVNLVPLVQNRFTDCKSELKYFEAAIVNVPTIASPTAVYSAAIKNSKTGFLCTTDAEWLNALEKLYNDPALRKAIAKNANKHAKTTYYGPAYLKAIESAYDTIVKA